MKKVKPVEVIECDFCGKDAAYNKCYVCGKDVCYQCVDQGKMSRLPASVYSESSNDIMLCSTCEPDDDDELVSACRAVLRLKRESDGFYADFKKRKDAAEDRVRKVKERQS